MAEQIKIDTKSIAISGNPSFITGNHNEVIKGSVDKTRPSPEKESYLFVITAKTSDGKDFVATGNTSKDEIKTAKITNYKVGNEERKLLEPLEVKIENGKLAAESLENFEQLINTGSITIGRFGSRKTIKSEDINLPKDSNLKAALEQANQPASEFKSAYSNVPNAKPTGKEVGIA
ncbi:MAG: hypothetical protein ABL867_07145 [Rickettsiales bacterium]